MQLASAQSESVVHVCAKLIAAKAIVRRAVRRISEVVEGEWTLDGVLR